MNVDVKPTVQTWRDILAKPREDRAVRWRRYATNFSVCRRVPAACPRRVTRQAWNSPLFPRKRRAKGGRVGVSY